MNKLMPFTPESIFKAIDESSKNKKPKRGEEGILHPITLKGQNYYAKEWRGKHYDGAQVTPMDFAYEDESKRTPVSPFWFKAQYYEGLLLQEAFPENTLRIEAGYDPRIKTHNGVPHFVYDQGRPVTVARAVESESDAQKKRDLIVDEMYDDYFDQFHPDKNGVLRMKSRLAALRMQEADYEILETFGEELAGSDFDWNQPRRSLLEREKAVASINPGSILIQFFRSGLLPIHPSLNFIPTRDSDRNGMGHVFIEVAIADLDLLRNRLLEADPSEEHAQRVDKKINLYKLYRNLDHIYDELFVSQNYSDDALRKDVEVVDTVFQILEAIRRHVSSGKSSDEMSLLKGVRRDLYWIFEDNKDRDSLMKELIAYKERFGDAPETNSP